MQSDLETVRGGTVLVVEARDLDTDERSRATVAVDRPRRSADERMQLDAVTTRLHPQARMRSFANGAASFLDRQHLIVAFYASSAGRPDARAPEPAATQAALFT